MEKDKLTALGGIRLFEGLPQPQLSRRMFLRSARAGLRVSSSKGRETLEDGNAHIRPLPPAAQGGPWPLALDGPA